jgi:hypothetical protein
MSLQVAVLFGCVGFLYFILSRASQLVLRDCKAARVVHISRLIRAVSVTRRESEGESACSRQVRGRTRLGAASYLRG